MDNSAHDHTNKDHIDNDKDIDKHQMQGYSNTTPIIDILIQKRR